MGLYRSYTLFLSSCPFLCTLAVSHSSEIHVKSERISHVQFFFDQSALGDICTGGKSFQIFNLIWFDLIWFVAHYKALLKLSLQKFPIFLPYRRVVACGNQLKAYDMIALFILINPALIAAARLEFAHLSEIQMCSMHKKSAIMLKIPHWNRKWLSPRHQSFRYHVPQEMATESLSH